MYGEKPDLPVGYHRAAHLLAYAAAVTSANPCMGEDIDLPVGHNHAAHLLARDVVAAAHP